MKLPEDPFIRELLPEFVETWVQDIGSQFNALIEEKNWDDLYRFGHTLKGSCLQFGLDNIAAQGIELMGYAKEHDLENANKMGDILKNSFIDVKTELENNPEFK